MEKRTEKGGEKREQIIRAASDLFFQKGFDGTSVRNIMKNAGGEVGLFYYYFRDKNEVFDQVLDSFFSRYQADFASIIQHGRRNPCRVMQDFFEYMECEVSSFRCRYAEFMHRTVRWAIREHTLTIIEPYIKEIIHIQSNYYKVAPAVVPEVATLYLTHGVGSAILHEDADQYLKCRGDIKRGVSLIMGMSIEEQDLRIPRPMTQADISAWIKFVTEDCETSPCFQYVSNEETLMKCIERGEAWVIEKAGVIHAGCLYSKENARINFLVVKKEYRRRRLATKLIETVAAQFAPGEVLSAITYCEDDSAESEARAFYKAFEFEEAEKIEFFKYPCVRMERRVPEIALSVKKT